MKIINIFSYRFTTILHGIWAIPVVGIIRIISPVLLIRLGTLRSDRIGHFVADAGQQFAVSLAPVLDFLAMVFQKILDANDAMGGYLIPTLGVILGSLIIIPKIIGLFTPLMALFSTTAPAAAPGKIAIKSLPIPSI